MESGGMLERLAAGDVRALARACSMMEDGAAGAAELLRGCEDLVRARGVRTCRIGLTGPPGAGKSTLADAMVRVLRARGETVGVVAVDPSSPYTGGALLGDRIRIQGFTGDAGVYIRSMASRGALGGVARAAEAVCTVMEAAGRDWVIVETVGVGQDEVSVAGLADVTVLVLVPGLGDDVQSLKAGVMEIADVFVVNKSDLPGADGVAREIVAMQSLATSHGNWLAPVVRTVAATGDGVEALLGEVARAIAAGKGRLNTDDTEKHRFGLGALADFVAPGDLGGRRGKKTTDATDERGSRGNGLAGVRLDHLGVAVRSIAEAKTFYELLGMRVAQEETVAHEGVKTAMLPMGESRVELLEPMGAETVIGRFLDKRGEGLHHVAVRVEGVDRKFEEMRAAGVRLASDSVKVGAGGHRYFFVHPASTGGVLVELVGD